MIGMIQFTVLITKIFPFKYSYAQSVGATHFETSAKNNMGVEDLFLSLTNMACENSNLI